MLPFLRTVVLAVALISTYTLAAAQSTRAEQPAVSDNAQAKEERNRELRTGEPRTSGDQKAYVATHPEPPVPTVAIDRKIVNAVMANNYDLVDPVAFESFQHDFELWLSAAPGNYVKLDERQQAYYQERNYKDLYMHALKKTILASETYRAMIDTTDK